MTWKGILALQSLGVNCARAHLRFRKSMPIVLSIMDSFERSPTA
jgi:hypothetical protein